MPPTCSPLILVLPIFKTCFSKPKERLVYSIKGCDKCHVGGDHHMGYYFKIITG